MRFNKIFFPAVILCSYLFATSCAKVGPAGANGLTGPTGPAYTNAVIMGHVYLYDQYGSKIAAGLNKVQLYLNNGNPFYPDTTGYYAFTAVPTGNYQILGADSAFGVTGTLPFQCILDTVYKDIRLSAIPTFSPAAISVFSSVGGDSIIISFANYTRTRSCILFMNNVYPASNQVTGYVAAYTKNFTGTTAIITIPAQDLTNLGFASGQ